MKVTALSAEQLLSKMVETRESHRPVWPALMGNGAGTVKDPDHQDKVFVRIHGLQSSVASVFNKIAPTNRQGLPVLIGTTRENPHLVQVLAIDWSAMPDWEGATLQPLHGPDHEAPSGPDPVYIQKRAVVPLRASPQAEPDMTLTIASDFYPWLGTWQYFAGATTEDLTARVPGANQHRYVTIYVDGVTNTLGCVNGTSVALTTSLGFDMMPVPPVGSVPICIVHLYDGITAITEAEIYDLRILISPLGGSLTPAIHDLEDYHTGQLDTRHLWASVACCGAQ